jgi:hypothetical protein
MCPQQYCARQAIITQSAPRREIESSMEPSLDAMWVGTLPHQVPNCKVLLLFSVFPCAIVAIK